MQTVEPPMQERQRREGGAGEGVSVPVDPLLFVGNGHTVHSLQSHSTLRRVEDSPKLKPQL